MIIGLTGKNCSGKGEAAKFLAERSFYYLSLSDVVREALQEAGIAITRDNLISMGNELRRKHGPAMLAEKLIARLEPDRNYVIDSIRNPSEIAALKKQGGFRLIIVQAPDRMRYERMKARRREGDPETFDEFLRLELIEEEGAEAEQQLAKCATLADFTIDNSGAIEELGHKIAEVVGRALGNFSRPGWDEYFMRIAKVVATRSNCVKRKVAAIIVKDRKIISTGYNGTPRGTKNCNEGGCPRCNSLAVGGTRLEECLCSHGEENAITQAAYHGVSLKDSTLYSTFAPCLLCTKMIINSGIVEVVYNIDYPLNETALDLLREARVKVRQFKVE